ncbi:MAG: FHA domain-containing protein [Prochloraceae cyanobacterium]|nr:FHA domain-containing protein [Prochloraceae cyanobacterium]
MRTLQQQFEHILVIKDRKERRMITLTKDIYTLGRSSKNGIVIYDRQVSRYHATLVRKQDMRTKKYSFWLIDGDLKGRRSTNGLLVNNKQSLSRKLKIGDVIGLSGTTTLKYYKFSRLALQKLLKPGQILNQAFLEKMLISNDENKKTIVT